MDKFVYKLIKEKKIQFKGGIFSILGFPNHMITTTNITTFFHIIRQKYGSSVNKSIREVGKKQIKAIANMLFSAPFSSLNITNVNLLLKYISLFGYGDIQIANVNNSAKEIGFQIKNSTYCAMKLKLFGMQKECSAPFLEGLCDGLAELIFDCPMISRETECIASYKERCFILSEKCQEKEEDSVLSKYTPNMLSIVKLETPNTQTDLMKKILAHRMMEWKNGVVSIWNASGYIIPVASFVFLQKALQEKYGSDVNSVIYHHTRAQAKNAVYLQEKTFGFKKDKKQMLSILDHTELTGFGIGKAEKMDFKNHELIIKGLDNPYPLYHKKIFGKSHLSVDHYFAGLMAGMGEGFFDMPMETTETMCVAKGDPYCLYEVKKRNSEEKYQIEKKYLQVIEEKITPKNFSL